MNGVQWEYRPGGSGGPGHMQRVGSPGEYTADTRAQGAYRAYLDHRAECLGCGETACGVADELWQAYGEANGTADQS